MVPRRKHPVGLKSLIGRGDRELTDDEKTKCATRNEITVSYEGLARNIANDFYRHEWVRAAWGYEDVVQEALTACLLAAEHVNPAYTHRKRTAYLGQAMRRHLQRHLNSSGLVWIPAYINTKKNREKNPARFARANRIRKMLGIELAANHGRRQENELEARDEIEKALRALSGLDGHEIGIVSDYYGLSGNGMTLDQLGEKYGLTREGARKRLIGVVEKIREVFMAGVH